MAQAVDFPLPALADELLIGIIEQFEHAESRHDLCNLALASSRFQALVEPALYQSILVRKGTTAFRLYGAILRRPVRANFIRSLHIQYLHTHRAGIGMLNYGLRKMSNLQELTIEGPCCNDKHSLVEGFESKGEIDYAEYFAFASSMTLESQPRVQVPLQTFTLHSHNEMGTGRNAFNMGRNAVIFLHPTLRNLTVSCFDIGEDIKAYLPANQNPTPLKSLTFDECNIAVAGLEAILSVPRALEKLTLGERMYLLRGNPHAQLGRSPAQFLQALALQKDSLQYLKHIGGRTDLPGSPTGLSMVTFPNMREMELDTYSILALVLSESAIPPNIHLRLIRSYILEQPSDVPEISPLPYILEWVRRVPQLEYVLDYDGREDEESILTDLWGDERNHKTWKKIFAVLGLRPTQPGDPTNKRSLRILVFKRSGFIPPYMYGEERPLEGVIFDSASHNARMVRLRDVAELLEDP